MDKEEEDLQFLGPLGIYEEACKIIFTWRKIFTQITLTLILPLTFIFLAHIEVSDLLLANILHNEEALDETRPGNPRYQKLSDLLSSEWTTFFLIKAAYFTFTLVFSLLSTSAVVYTVAGIYTGRELDFKKTMTVVPKVWKRLMLTFLTIFLVGVAYNVAAVLVLVFFGILFAPGAFGLAVFLVLGFFYIIGLVYMSIVWYLASVVSVLEDFSSISAMLKSRELLRGKMVTVSVIFVKLNFLFYVIQFAFERLAVHGESLGTASRVGYGSLCFLLLLQLMLFGLVVQTVIYFVCKSYHHENIDKSALADHLESYLGDYVPLKTKDVQLEQFHV